jgi:hypothetical protein
MGRSSQPPITGSYSWHVSLSCLLLDKEDTPRNVVSAPRRW